MPDIIYLHDLAIPILRTKRRKTVSIRIKKAQAQVYAPMSVSRSFIQAFVASKANWIYKHLKAHQEHAQKKSAQKFNLHEGASVRVLGQNLLLRLVPDLPVIAEQAGDSLLIAAPNNLSSAQALFVGLRAYAMEQSVKILTALVSQYAVQLGVQPKQITIKEYRSRWGSCNARKEVQFNWLIALAPLQAMEYVVVHELCHLIHFNHSPAFWAAVQKAMPDYSVWRRWFSTYGESLWSVLEYKNNAH
jgi:predicted metal-dependent hydrolase